MFFIIWETYANIIDFLENGTFFVTSQKGIGAAKRLRMFSLFDRIEVVLGDITTFEVDAIVNAANSNLTDGCGVNGAIHQAAGPQLLTECYQLGECETGQAKITGGYLLPAKYIIHTVGPMWHGGQYREEDLLASCYQTSLKLAVEHKCKTIALPAISCGIYGFPVKLAAEIAIREVTRFLKKDDSIQKLYFVCFEEEVFNVYNSVWQTFLAAEYPLSQGSLQETAQKIPSPPNKFMAKQLVAGIQRGKIKKFKSKNRFFR